ncbi:MAG TPA: LysR family transcriptional regulator, partial [Polyangiaceae bacterium]
MDWDDLRVFLAVHRTGSHKGAARALGVDATTVSRRITALESALGARLFSRTPDRHEATNAGQMLAERAERMETEALAGERELAA